MFVSNFRTFGIVAVPLVVVTLLAFPAGAEEKEVTRLQELMRQLQKTIEAEAEQYSIGLAAEPAEKGGLLVKGVLANSPAAKAGLQEGDLITKLNRAPLNELEDLRAAVANSKGEALHLQITRAGQAKGITVTPDKRGGGLLRIVEEAEEGRAPAKPNPANPQPQKQANPAPRFQPQSGSSWVPAPGQPGSIAQGIALMMGPAAPQAALPDDMEVTITKQGNKPAIIKVKQGVKSWKTDETELGMLPQPAQAYAARHLGKTPTVLGMNPAAPAFSGAPQGGGAPVRFQLKTTEERKTEGNPQRTVSPKVKQLPGGGLQIEIREEDEKEPSKPQGKPEPKKNEPAQGAGPKVKVIPGGVQIEIGEK